MEKNLVQNKGYALWWKRWLSVKQSSMEDVKEENSRQSVVQKQQQQKKPLRKVLEMQILRPLLRPTEPKSLGKKPAV